MKRIVALVLSAMTLTFVLSSCAKEEKKTLTAETKEEIKTTTEEEKMEEKIKLWFFYGLYDNNCEEMSPIVKEIATEFGDAVEFKRLDIDVYDEEMTKFQVDGYNIPATLIIKNDEVLARFAGVVDKSEIENALKEALGK